VASVTFNEVSKAYPIYDSPVDRLKELVTFHRSRHHEVFWALRDVSFEAAKGSTFCVIGENGSGKSTSLQLVAGIFPPTEGQVEVNGRVSALLELGAGFNPEFSGRDNVFLSAAIHGLSTKEIERRFRDIEQFAEIGEFIHQPVKTYSSGMLVRLAFAVAIHVDPDILLVDEALAVGDYYFRQRCMRKVHELRRRQVTILFVSHSMADVKAIGSDALWLENGRMVELGKPDAVVRKYLARMVEKDAEFLKRKDAAAPRSEEPAAAVVAPEIAETIPNIDFRHGNKAAEIIGIAALDAEGREVRLIEPHRRLTVRISVRASRALDEPNVGFMLRNHMGMDFAGTNTAREGISVPPMAPGDTFTVDFHLDIPELYPGNFSFSPAIANGSLEAYEMCDWIDNALTLPMARGDGAVYGYIHLPCRIDINTPLRKPQPAQPPVSSWKGS
jgi:ABC-type polysaccharide/polyol phosphate transport system ATPase subunit